MIAWCQRNLRETLTFALVLGAVIAIVVLTHR